MLRKETVIGANALNTLRVHATVNPCVQTIPTRFVAEVAVLTDCTAIVVGTKTIPLVGTITGSGTLRAAIIAAIIAEGFYVDTAYEFPSNVEIKQDGAGFIIEVWTEAGMTAIIEDDIPALFTGYSMPATMCQYAGELPYGVASVTVNGAVTALGTLAAAGGPALKTAIEAALTEAELVTVSENTTTDIYTVSFWLEKSVVLFNAVASPGASCHRTLLA